jgi:MFS family permease
MERGPINLNTPEVRRAMVTKGSLWALLLISLANLFNYLDRSILSILAEDIKRSLDISDASIGFLYGTVFSALYAAFGVAVGRLADRWNRTKLLTIGLTIWSGMTALSAFATNLPSLAAARLGVSAGESVANPASQSLISDYFPRDVRATAFAVYLCGGLIGGGIAIAGGGAVLSNWPTIASYLGAPFTAIEPWQGAFLICGVPGLIVACAIAGLKEPARGAHEVGYQAGADASAGEAFKHLAIDLATVIPPISFFRFYFFARALFVWNCVGAAIIVACGMALTALTGDWQQWAGVGVAAYAILSIAQSISLTDPELFQRTFKSGVFLAFAAGLALVSCVNSASQFWAAPYMLRTFEISAISGGAILGAILAGGGFVGIIGGGMLTDWIRRKDARAAIWLALASLLIPLPLAAVVFVVPDLTLFFVGLTLIVTLQSMMMGGAAALIQELMTPRTRASGAAIFSMLIIVSTFAIGPYLAGKISEVTGELRIGILSLYLLAPAAAFLLLLAARLLRARMLLDDQAASGAR